jgi:hypothetical protein
MPRVASVVLLLLVPATARADAAPIVPGYRGVWVDFIFTVEQGYPGYEFYLVSPLSWMDSHPPERLPLTPSNPIRVSGSGPGPGEDNRYKYGARVYAVRESLLTGGTGPPSRTWFFRERDGLVLLGETPESCAALPFTDNRERIEFTYRVEIGPDGGQLVKVGENAGNSWVKRGWIAAAIFISLGIVGLGLRWVWGARRRRVPERPTTGSQ